MNREKVIATVNDMPKNFDLDTLLEKLIFIEKVEKGLKQAEEGKLISNSEVKQLVSKWPK